MATATLEVPTRRRRPRERPVERPCERCGLEIEGESVEQRWRTRLGGIVVKTFCGEECERRFRRAVLALNSEAR
jgi:hypothetical protein